MSVYKYKATDKKGLKYFGVVRAESTEEAEKKIKLKGLEVVLVEQKNLFFDKIFSHIGLFGYTSAWEKSANLRQIGTMVKAGVPIVRALRVVEKTTNPHLKRIFSQIINDLCEGKNFSTACKKHPKFLTPIDVHIIEAGEATGTLDKALLRLADQKEEEADIKRGVQGAMIYPIIVMLVIIAVIAVMLTRVIPILAETFTASNVPLPLPTLILVEISNFVISAWWVIILLLVLIMAVLIIYFRNTLLGNYIWGYVKLKSPIFGNLHETISLSQICSTMSLLSTSGVSIVEAIKLTGGVANNEIYKRTFFKIAGILEKGKSLSSSMEVYNRIFPPIMVNMISAGEESGTMEQMLEVLSNYYMKDAQAKIKTLTSSLEPILIIFLGVAVAFVIFAVMVPIYNLANVYQ